MLLAISTAVFVARRKCPYLLFGWLWYLGTLVPVIGLVQVGSQAMADRYTYLTQIGLYMAIAWGAADVAGSWPYRRWPLAAVSALVVAGLMVCAWQQTRHWRDSETLWTHTLACTSQNPIAHNNLGIALAGRGQVDEAIAHYRKALEIKPDYVGGPQQPRTCVGRPRTGRRGHRPLPEGPGNQARLRGRPTTTSASPWPAADRVDEAIAHYRKALEIKPDYAEAHNNLGVRAGRPRTGRRGDRPLPEGPGNQARRRQAHNNLGVALAGCGQVDEAIEHCQKALDLATARNDRVLEPTTFCARIRSCQRAAPAGHTP